MLKVLEVSYDTDLRVVAYMLSVGRTITYILLILGVHWSSKRVRANDKGKRKYDTVTE